MNQMKKDVILKPNRKFYPEKNYSHQELVLHATLLSRIFFNNNYSRKRSKQKDLKLFNLASNEELKEYIIHWSFLKNCLMAGRLRPNLLPEAPFGLQKAVLL